MFLPIVSLYLGLCALFLVGLSVHVIRQRLRYGVGIGDGEEEMLRRACRAQANFIEYTPMLLLLILVGEIQGGMAALLHVLGMMLLVGRVLHAYSLLVVEVTSVANGGKRNIRFRQAGMALTFIALVIGGIHCMMLAFIQ